jgi:DDE superfamily endonuclease
VAFSIAWLEAGVEPRADEARARELLAVFRRDLYRCFTARADALFEPADAVLCAEGPVKTLVGLSLVPEHRRGHRALYDALNAGQADVARLRWSLVALPLPCWGDGRIRLAVDVNNWLRPRRRPTRSECSAMCMPGAGQCADGPGHHRAAPGSAWPGRPGAQQQANCGRRPGIRLPCTHARRQC